MLHGDVSEVPIQRHKKLGRLHVQGGDDAFDVGQGDVALATLHTTQIATIEASSTGRRSLARNRALCATAAPPAQRPAAQAQGHTGVLFYPWLLWLQERDNLATDHESTG